MYGRSEVNVKVERSFSYFVSILFTHVKPVKVYVCTHVKITRQWKFTLSIVLLQLHGRADLQLITDLEATSL